MRKAANWCDAASIECSIVAGLEESLATTRAREKKLADVLEICIATLHVELANEIESVKNQRTGKIDVPEDAAYVADYKALIEGAEAVLAACQEPKAVKARRGK